MGFVKSSVSALGKLAFVVALGAAFLAGMVGVVYMSLQGTEIQVPEIVGKNYKDSETELASLGLKIHKKAERYSNEPPNTIIEQLPRPGETVKTGQMITVVTSIQNADSDEAAPVTINKNTNESDDDVEKIKEMITDKPKKTNKANSNVAKNKSRDSANNSSTSESNTSSGSTTGDPGKATGSENNSSDKANRAPSNPANKQGSGTTKTNTSRGTGDVRPRVTPKP